MEVSIYFEHHLEGMGTTNRKDFSFRLKSFKGIYVTVLTCCCGEPAGALSFYDRDFLSSRLGGGLNEYLPHTHLPQRNQSGIEIQGALCRI